MIFLLVIEVYIVYFRIVVIMLFLKREMEYILLSEKCFDWFGIKIEKRLIEGERIISIE